MRIIAFTNQKGGVGKTTSCVNLGACLSKAGRKVLFIDLDSQANLTIHLGLNPRELKTSIYDVISPGSESSLKDVILKSNDSNLDVVPSSPGLTSLEINLAGEARRETVLKNALGNIRSYDYIFIDCPPSLGLLTLNALTTAREVFVPVQVEYFALEGMTRLLETIALVKKRLNSSLEITGIIPVMYDVRTNLSQAILERIKEHFKGKVFNTVIRQNVRLAEAPSFGKSIIAYSPNSYGAKDYMKLAKEVMKSG